MWPKVIADVLIAYAAVGLLFAAAFVLRGASRLDEAAGRSGWPFRLVILPASAALWPYLLLRWLAARGGEQ